MRLLQSIFVLFFTTLALPAPASSLIYVPETFEPARADVVVVIHGCLQTPEAMALGTGWNQIADRENLVILYPQVPTDSHPLDCWSWYLPENQKSESGQLRWVRDEILAWKSRLKIEASRVYVAGISSGAATAAGLLACFPEDFAAGALHSGPPYGLASTPEEAARILRDGAPESWPRRGPCDPARYRKPVMILQGTADPVVNPANAQRIREDFFGEAILAATRLGVENQLNYRIDDYRSPEGPRGRVVLVTGLGHAWAGHAENLRHSDLLGPGGRFPTNVPFFSPLGPSSTNLIFEFFRE